MFDIANPVHWTIGVVFLGAVILLLRGHFSAEAREQRRRERNHRRVVSKARRPMVRLAVKTEKPQKLRSR